jgi:hypothetical protein
MTASAYAAVTAILLLCPGIGCTRRDRLRVQVADAVTLSPLSGVRVQISPVWSLRGPWTSVSDGDGIATVRTDLDASSMFNGRVYTNTAEYYFLITPDRVRAGKYEASVAPLNGSGGEIQLAISLEQ